MFDNPKDQQDGWMAIVSDASHRDLLHPDLPFEEQPQSIADSYSSHRWLKWWMMAARRDPSTVEGTRRYACSLATTAEKDQKLRVFFFRKVENGFVPDLLDSFYCEPEFKM